MAKLALLIGVSEYEPGFGALPASVRDVDAVQRVLVHPEMGDFAEADITVLKNPLRQEMEDAIYRLFSDRKKDDLLLFYFSGHGIKDDSGNLFLATRATRKAANGTLIPPSAVAARFLHDCINGSRSPRQVIILDCCFSGAIAQGMTVKDDGTVNLQAHLGGKGRAILTSSTSAEYSFGSQAAAHEDSAGLSVYTRYLVEGIETGAADADDDGLIAVEELHEYASGRVKEAAPAMTPKFYPVEEGYKIVLARSPKNDLKLKYRKEVKARAEQGQGKFSVFARRILNSKRTDWGISSKEAGVIEDEVLQPYREYERKLQEYEQAITEAVQIEYPFSENDEADLREYQRYLGLRNSDIAAVEMRVLSFFGTEYEWQQEASKRQKAIAHYEQGRILHKLGKLNEAIAQYRLAIKLGIDDPRAYTNLGIVLAAQGKMQEAIEQYRHAIQLVAEYARIHHNLGIALAAQGKLDEAIAQYHQALQLNPNFALAYKGMGIALAAQGKLDEAIAQYHQALQLDPSDEVAYNKLGIALKAQGKKQEAEEAFRKAEQFGYKQN